MEGRKGMVPLMRSKCKAAVEGLVQRQACGHLIHQAAAWYMGWAE